MLCLEAEAAIPAVVRTIETRHRHVRHERIIDLETGLRRPDLERETSARSRQPACEGHRTVRDTRRFDPIPREAYLFAMETMLQKHLGGPAPEPAGQRLRAYLRENLRLAGPEFVTFAAKPR